MTPQDTIEKVGYWGDASGKPSSGSSGKNADTGMTTPHTTPSLVEEEIELFKKEFLDKLFPKSVDIYMPDMDSRGIRQRGTDFLRSSLSRIQEATRREVVEEIAEEVRGGRIPDGRFNGAPIDEVYHRGVGHNRATDYVLSLLQAKQEKV